MSMRLSVRVKGLAPAVYAVISCVQVRRNHHAAMFYEDGFMPLVNWVRLRLTGRSGWMR